MNSGWIKLSRCVLDSFFYNDSEAVHLWIHLLVSVNHKEKEILLSGKKVCINPGDIVCSRFTLSDKTGISDSKIQRLLKIFESEQMIKQQMNSKFRIISISNWTKYQSCEQVDEQQPNSKRTAGEQHTNTNKKEENKKNEKNERKEENTKSKPKGLLDVYFQFILLGIIPPRAYIKATEFMGHYNSNGWKVGGKSAMKDWKGAAVGIWMKDETRLIGYQETHMSYILEELVKQYGPEEQYNPMDFKILYNSRPELFSDDFCFNPGWVNYVRGLK